MRILVIEDNRDILANVLDYLQIKGYNIDCAQDGLSGFGAVFGDFGHAVIGEAILRRQLAVDVPVQHVGPCLFIDWESSAQSLASSGCAR